MRKGIVKLMAMMIVGMVIVGSALVCNSVLVSAINKLESNGVLYVYCFKDEQVVYKEVLVNEPFTLIPAGTGNGAFDRCLIEDRKFR